MSDCEKKVKCCDPSPFGECCQPDDFGYVANVWWNTEQECTAICPPGLIGPPVTVVVPEHTYPSNVSQADANTIAHTAACDEAASQLQCDEVVECQTFSVNQTIDFDAICPSPPYNEPFSLTVTSGPCQQKDYITAFNLYDTFPYAEFHTGICPTYCQTARPHPNGPLVIGPYDFDVEIYTITGMATDDDWGFDGTPEHGECCNGDTAGGIILKTLPANTTTEFDIYEKFGAYTWAAGWIGVRRVGRDTSCGSCVNTDVPRPPQPCGCSEATVEQEMRAMQERRTIVGGTVAPWPDRVNPSPSVTPDYPVDGWYDGDSSDALRAIQVQAIFDALDDTWLDNYAATTNWEGAATIVMHSVLTTMPIPVVTDLTWEAELLKVQSYCCEMQYIKWVAAYAVSDQKVGGGTDADCGTAASACEAAYLAAAFGGASYFTMLEGSAEIGGLYQYSLARGRFEMHFDLSGFVLGMGETSMWGIFVPDGFPVPLLAHADLCPIVPDSLFHAMSGSPELGNADTASPFYGNSGAAVATELTCQAPMVSISGGWTSGETPFAQIFKSNNPNLGHWLYYP